MDTTNPHLPLSIEAAVVQQHGGPVAIPGAHGTYVVMNADVYGGQMVQATTEEHSDSIAAIQRSLAQAALGELEEAERFFRELEQQYES
jgi:hypothetical protein